MHGLLCFIPRPLLKLTGHGSGCEQPQSARACHLSIEADFMSDLTSNCVSHTATLALEMQTATDIDWKRLKNVRESSVFKDASNHSHAIHANFSTFIEVNPILFAR